MLLLHTCCAPCSAAIIEWLVNNGIRPTLFYFNPNIYPEEEYLVRKSECTRYAGSLELEIIDGDYDHNGWLSCITGMEQEPERGNRCFECFRMRMLATAKLTRELGYKEFATTLASSRWKSLEQIARAGHWAASQYEGVTFWEKNWRKGGLSERRRILLAENNFYNQTYCGCEFSIRHRLPEKQEEREDAVISNDPKNS
ncbi:MAG: epoxyqueuosine reductase QueH [Tannerellaceae bacterium]|nr:epoxyqueuosine reductase QueH [Tannerellaceae bacterium]